MDKNKSTKPEQTSLYEGRKKVYPREVKGKFSSLKNRLLLFFMSLYFLTPWLNWDNHQAFLFSEGKFYLFSLVIWPQDFYILSLFLLLSAFTLFFITTLSGRVWCGFACPQTLWTEAFVWIERFCEGSRSQQMRLDKQKTNFDKIRKKGLKFFLWFLFSIITGMTLVGYFTPIRQLLINFFTFNASLTAYGFTFLFAAVFFLFAGVLKEQVCTSMCPYGRFQGAMYDENTFLVTYNLGRGEPRRKAKKGENDDGHCVDCSLCVQVCPTGIDIRDGSQYKCIGCSYCIDACDSIMTKLNAPTGLIKYASSNSIKGKNIKLIRPKSIGYGSFILLGFVVLFYKLATISTIDLNVKQDRNIVARYAEDGNVDNIYNINILNKTNDNQEYKIYASGIEGIKLKSRTSIFKVEAGGVVDKTIKFSVNDDNLEANTTIEVTIENIKTGEKVTRNAPFSKVK